MVTVERHHIRDERRLTFEVMPELRSARYERLLRTAQPSVVRSGLVSYLSSVLDDTAARAVAAEVFRCLVERDVLKVEVV